MQISIVIPTCERKIRLLSLLQNLNRSSFPVEEVIVVDSGNDQLLPAEYSLFASLNIKYITSEKSVCIQRNKGISAAKSSWIFLCDDDIELPVDYLQKLVNHIAAHPEAGAVSGVWLQQEKNEWLASYPVRSPFMLVWKFIFQLGIWGEINCKSNNPVITKIKQYYKKKGNHISKAGWPVNIDFKGDYIVCPVYSLGASLVKREWLIQSPYDEVLDKHGIGDNYGVAAGFPFLGIHVVNDVFVYHQKEPANRLNDSVQYYRRTLALDYFRKTKSRLKGIGKFRLIWSLVGNLAGFLYARDYCKIKASLKAIFIIALERNPYYMANKKKLKVIEPLLQRKSISSNDTSM